MNIDYDLVFTKIEALYNSIHNEGIQLLSGDKITKEEYVRSITLADCGDKIIHLQKELLDEMLVKHREEK
jgi:hypothetical protein